MYIKMENIFENLNVSEECLEDILEKVFESLTDARREKLVGAIQSAKDGKYRTKALRVLGKVQQRLNKEQARAKEDVKNSGITFTDKMLK